MLISCIVKNVKNVKRRKENNHESVKDKIEEIKDIQLMLDNNDPEVKGDRRGWKRNINELKQEIIELGYAPEEYLY